MAAPITPLESEQFFPIKRGWAFIVFLFVYTVPGLVGHQPWRQDETYIVEILRSMLATGDFVVPTMAGEAFMEKPSLFYWVAGGFAKLLSPGLAFHDAARIATACFVLLTCGAVARSGRRWRDRDFGRTAVASYRLGESERSMLSYYHGIITRRLELGPNSKCRVVLVEGLRMRPPNAVDRRLWKKSGRVRVRPIHANISGFTNVNHLRLRIIWPGIVKLPPAARPL